MKEDAAQQNCGTIAHASALTPPVPWSPTGASGAGAVPYVHILADPAGASGWGVRLKLTEIQRWSR